MLQCQTKETTDKFRLENFKSSRSWCEKFLKRKTLFQTKNLVNLPKTSVDFEEKPIQFQRDVIGTEEHGNADETRVCLDMPRNYE